MSKKICCVNDMPGVGKIALSAMIPILSAKGISITCLPTALVSNTLDFGKFEILDTSDYMDKTVDVWHELGFQFDCISTGFMVNPKQIQIVEKLIQHQNQALVVVDPIFGDEGKLYNGMNETNVKIMQELARFADILIPNYTEACFLTNTPCKENMTLKEAEELINKCLELKAKSIIITSAVVSNRNCVLGYDHIKDDFFTIDYEMIDVRFPGTGDIFSAVLTADVLNQFSLHEATYHAMNVVSELIKDNLDVEEKYAGVNIERFIKEGRL